MGIQLNLTVTSPLTSEDRDLLSGITVMLLAISNRNLAQEAFPEVFQPAEEEQAGVGTAAIGPQPCGLVAEDGAVCVSKVGHRGRHRYRQTSLVN